MKNQIIHLQSSPFIPFWSVFRRLLKVRPPMCHTSIMLYTRVSCGAEWRRLLSSRHGQSKTQTADGARIKRTENKTQVRRARAHTRTGRRLAVMDETDRANERVVRVCAMRRVGNTCGGVCEPPTERSRFCPHSASSRRARCYRSVGRAELEPLKTRSGLADAGPTRNPAVCFSIKGPPVMFCLT